MFQMINHSDKQKISLKIALEMKNEAIGTAAPLIYLKLDPSDIINPAKRAAADVLKELGDGNVVSAKRLVDCVERMNQAVHEVYARWNSKRPIVKKYPVPVIKLGERCGKYVVYDSDYLVFATGAVTEIKL